MKVLIMKVCISGISGRMGTEVKNLLEYDEISGGITSSSTPTEIENIIRNSEIVIDFSSVSNILNIINICALYKIPIVSGTTGFSEREFDKFKSYSNKIALLYASNFSIGIYQVANLLKESEKVLDGFDISIIDRHHNKKKDAPSGTALFLASQLNKNPQIVSLRIGGIPGDHICSFTSNDEEVIIAHRSFNRRVFASSAIKCAKWLVNKSEGFYDLGDYIHDKR